MYFVGGDPEPVVASLVRDSGKRFIDPWFVYETHDAEKADLELTYVKPTDFHPEPSLFHSPEEADEGDGGKTNKLVHDRDLEQGLFCGISAWTRSINALPNPPVVECISPKTISPEGVYSYRIFANGEMEAYVLTDDWLPSPKDSNRPYDFHSSRTGNQHCADAAEMFGTDAIALTGFGGGNDELGLVGAHGYSIVAAYLDQEGGRFFTLWKNPWQGGAPNEKFPWSPTSPIWHEHPDLASKLQHGILDVDGCFWVERKPLMEHGTQSGRMNPILSLPPSAGYQTQAMVGTIKQHTRKEQCPTVVVSVPTVSDASDGSAVLYWGVETHRNRWQAKNLRVYIDVHECNEDGSGVYSECVKTTEGACFDLGREPYHHRLRIPAGKKYALVVRPHYWDADNINPEGEPFSLRLCAKGGVETDRKFISFSDLSQLSGQAPVITEMRTKRREKYGDPNSPIKLATHHGEDITLDIQYLVKERDPLFVSGSSFKLKLDHTTKKFWPDFAPGVPKKFIIELRDGQRFDHQDGDLVTFPLP
uniref:Calpain catalytic domain-containing protein n=1 Tax=Chromera velia CCMP2878 TaxID=1169474 RepID=A0A0G4FPI2_9ALVE|eukprot:Cvel_17937.t1-p1 / transcript=Cvel_17937.t1 / gene=Cvel_17937 / organism=Chromera_velia_CCMP2878 / gene_product=hypothetical protein / transcript_product=hypothetical protein / location=Cvel_scaffold1458:8649-10421(+) / protein_length=532 / sequence_SO=supercontig / SO=protein_coding / is_pseudo=false